MKSNPTRNDRAPTKAIVAHEQQTPMRHLLCLDRPEVGPMAKAVNNPDVAGEHKAILKVTTGEHVQHDFLVHDDDLAIRPALGKLPDERPLHAATGCPFAPRNVNERFQRFGSNQPLAVVQFWKVALSHDFSEG